MPFGLSDKAICAITDVLKKFPEVEEAVLYGSRAKGNYHEGSDIDLTLKGEKLNLDTLNAISWRLDDLLLPQKIDLSMYHRINNPNLIDHIQRVGKTLYKKAATLEPNP
jgi:predicted nucleotidyltransferase